MTANQVMTYLQISASKVLGTSLSGVPMDRILTFNEASKIIDGTIHVFGSKLSYSPVWQVTFRKLVQDYIQAFVDEESVVGSKL